ncbi:MAG: AraC family transcriptional regulator ligand-binding domain-containing protein [Pseudomonadota bacterium]
MRETWGLPSASVLATVGRDLPDFLAQHSVDINLLIGPLGFSVDTFTDLDARIDLDLFCRLMEAGAAITGHDDFGVGYSNYYSTGGTGAFAQGLLAAPTLRHMLLFFAKYIDTVVDHRQFNLTLDRQCAVIEWEYSPVVLSPEQFTDFSVNQVLKVISFLTNGRQRFLGFELMREAPPNGSMHQHAFAAPIDFNAPVNRMTMTATLLDEHNSASNPVLFELMNRECQKELDRQIDQKSLSDVLRENIIQALPRGGMTIERAASAVGMSKRTLQRRLSDAGRTYEQLVEETRFALVEAKLRNRVIPLSVIAAEVGYSEQSAFTRAVTKYFGETPTKLRQRLQRV